MSLIESLFVGIFGISVVFIVLIALSQLIRLQAFLVARFTQKKPVEAVVPAVAVETTVEEEPAAAVPSAEYVAAEALLKRVDADGAGAFLAGRPGCDFDEGSECGGQLKKYIVTVNDKKYTVEADNGEARSVRATVAVKPSISAPVAAPVSIAAPVPAPAPKNPAPVKAPAQEAVKPSAEGKEVVTAPVPGTVVEIKVQVGSKVKRGEILVLLEAMKMENEIVAGRDGTVEKVLTSKGATVEMGTPLIEIQ